MIEDYFRRSPGINAAKIRKQAELGQLAAQVRIVEGHYDLETGKLDWRAK